MGNITTTLKYIISCETLNYLHVSFNGSCFGHALNKTIQYATNVENISKDLGLISLKFAQTSFQACSTWPKIRYVC
jgi:hypothetical protein